MAREMNDKNHVYIEGNTVRSQQTAPSRRETAPDRRQTVPHRQPVMPEISREEIRRKRERRLSAKRNSERAMSFTLRYMIFLTAVTAICFGACILFVHLQANITTHMAAVTSLETQISDLKSDNDAAESRLESAMTLSEIKLRAAELGLVYPSSEQIRYYSVESSDYMNQYSDVESD